MAQEAVFRTYRDSHRSEGKGAAYDQRYAENDRRRLFWALEQRVLEAILQARFRDQQIHLLDFACGTGRLTRFLEEQVTTSTGVDVSTSMLEVARKKVKRTRLIQADLTMHNVLGSRRFNLITAFRFFLNAEPELRKQVIGVLASLLGPAGYLVFNNHRNLSAPWSVASHIRNRRNSRAPLHRFMSLHDMRSLAAGAGLKVVEVCHVGVVPPPFYGILPLSWIWRAEDRAMRYRLLMPFSEELIAVCQHR